MLKLTKDDRWEDFAPCSGDTTDRSSSVRLKELNQFINQYCLSCPVAQHCLDEAVHVNYSGYTIDDSYYVVRGGYLPTRVKPRDPGRPPGAKNKEPRYKRTKAGPTWTAKPAPATIGTGSRLLERGACLKGLHGIESEDDLSQSQGCRACHEAAKRRYSIRRAAGIKPAARTHCKNGLHEWIPENIRTRTRKSGAHGVKSSNSCRPCENAVSRRASEERRATLAA